MRHLLFPGGKRLRPALAMAAAEALGRPPQLALPAAVAVELIHTYSLVHDDLPCMDDDTERRGRPTVHVQYGETVAVLAGDALQALAFEALARGVDPSAPERTALALRDLAIAAGSRGLVGGQVDDLAFALDGDAKQKVESIHARKSAALIAASIVTGARLAGADEPLLGRLRGFGLDIGVAFQIADDLLDEDDDDPCSLVRVTGAEAARSRSEELLEAGLARLADLGEAAEPLRALGRFAVRRRE
jgi:geranylgeranyl pyrophosphate synthase